MPNYKASKIYKLVSHHTDDVYYGSTTQTLSQRLGGHRRDYKRWMAGERSYITSFELIKHDDCEIILMESYPSSSKKEELHAIERKWIEENQCVNKIVPGRTLKEYYQDNKQKISERKQQYYQANKGGICEQKKQYWQANKQKISERYRRYMQANKQKISERNRQYRQANKQKISARRRELREEKKQQAAAGTDEVYASDRVIHKFRD